MWRSIGALCAMLFGMTLQANAQTLAASPSPPPEGPISVVTYVETAPDWVAHAATALRAYRGAARAEAGAGSVDVYREIHRDNRFVINEVWSDFAAYQAHEAVSTLAMALKAGHLAPPDSRKHSDWSVAAPARTPNPDALFVFTHIDVSPPQLAGLQDILTPYIQASRADTGSLRFDLLQGLAPRRNHQTLAESWATGRDFLAHQRSAHAIAFRDKLGPLLGALYDQRLYRLEK